MSDFDFKDSEGNVGDIKTVTPEVESPEGALGKLVIVSVAPSMDTTEGLLDSVKFEVEKKFHEAVSLEVNSTATAKEALLLASNQAKLAKAINARRLEISKQPRDFISRLKNLVDPLIDTCKNTEKLLKNKCAVYQKREEQEQAKREKQLEEQRQKLQDKLNKEAEEAGVEAITVPEFAKPKADKKLRAGTSQLITSKRWVVDIIKGKEDEVPREYCSPDKKKLMEAVKAGKRDGDIPGVKIYQRDEQRIRG